MINNSKRWKQPKYPSMMLYIYSTEYSLAFKRREIVTHAIRWMNLEDTMLSEISQLQMDTVWFQYEVPRTVKSTETENRTMVVRGLGIEENWNLLFNGYRVSVGEVEYFPQMDCGGTCTTMWIYLMLLNCTLKIGSSDKFYVICVLPQ